MSVLGGFDVVVELGPSGLRSFVADALSQATGSPTLPPFDLGDGVTTATVKQLDATFSTGELRMRSNHIVVVLTFECGQTPSTSGHGWDTGFTGTLTFLAPIVLDVDTTANVGRLVVQLQSAIAIVHIDQTGAAASNFKALMELGAAELLPTLGETTAASFAVVAGSDGTFSPVQFEQLQMKFVSAANGDVILCLLATLFAANHAKGDPSTKTTVAIGPDEHIATSLSPQVIDSVMCPILTAQVPPAFNADPSQMPPTCGTGTGFMLPKDPNSSDPDIKVTRISDRLAAGAIAIDISAHADATCYTADAQLTILAVPKIQFGEVTFDLQVQTPQIDTHVKWWCAALAILADLVVAGIAIPIGPVVAVALAGGALYEIGQQTSAAQQTAKTSVQDALAGIHAGLTGASPDVVDVRITPTEFTLVNGKGGLPPNTEPAGWVGLAPVLAGDTPVAISPLDPQLIYHSTTCPQGDFPYVEYQQVQHVTVTITTHRFCRPLQQNDWYFDVVGQLHAIQTGSNVLTFTPQALLPTPLPNGTPIQPRIDLAYTFDGDKLTFTTDPADGCWSIQLVCNFTDAHGQTYTARTYIDVVGDYVDIGGGFNQAAQVCDELMRGAIAAAAHQRLQLLGMSSPTAPWEDSSIDVLRQAASTPVEGGLEFAATRALLQTPRERLIGSILLQAAGAAERERTT